MNAYCISKHNYLKYFKLMITYTLFNYDNNILALYHFYLIKYYYVFNLNLKNNKEMNIIHSSILIKVMRIHFI